MCKQMILTVLIVACALGAEPELQVLPVLFRPAADHAPVLIALLRRDSDFLRISPAAFDLLWRKFIPPGGQEEDDKIQKGHQRRHTVGRHGQDSELSQGKPGRTADGHHKTGDDGDEKVKSVGITQVFALDGDDKKQ